LENTPFPSRGISACHLRVENMTNGMRNSGGNIKEKGRKREDTQENLS
jgi:hypothetical protein